MGGNQSTSTKKDYRYYIMAKCRNTMFKTPNQNFDYAGRSLVNCLLNFSFIKPNSILNSVYVILYKTYINTDMTNTKLDMELKKTTDKNQIHKIKQHVKT